MVCTQNSQELEKKIQAEGLRDHISLSLSISRSQLRGEPAAGKRPNIGRSHCGCSRIRCRLAYEINQVNFFLQLCTMVPTLDVQTFYTLFVHLCLTVSLSLGTHVCMGVLVWGCRLVNTQSSLSFPEVFRRKGGIEKFPAVFGRLKLSLIDIRPKLLGDFVNFF